MQNWDAMKGMIPGGWSGISTGVWTISWLSKMVKDAFG